MQTNLLRNPEQPKPEEVPDQPIPDMPNPPTPEIPAETPMPIKEPPSPTS